MTGIDLLILAVILLSGVISLLRGFLREAINLVIWITAIGVVLLFSSRFSTLLPPVFESPSARLAVSATTLFFGTMIIGALINWLFQKAVSGNVLGTTDRLLGAAFGMARGALIVALVVLLAHLAPTITQEQWWQNSALLPRFERVAGFIHEHLPVEVAGFFDFGQAG